MTEYVYKFNSLHRIYNDAVAVMQIVISLPIVFCVFSNCMMYVLPSGVKKNDNDNTCTGGAFVCSLCCVYVLWILLV